MVALQFNAQGVDPEWGSTGGQLWSDNSWNKVIITGSDTRENNDKSKGGHLGLTIKSIEGPDAGKEGYIAVNLFHVDPAVRERAAAQMAAILWVVGRPAIQTDTTEIHNIPFYIENKHRMRKVNGQDVPANNFSGVRNLQGIEPGKASGGPTAAAPSMPGAPQMPPGAPQAPGGWPGAGAPQSPPTPGGPGWGAPPAPFSPAPAAPSFGPPPAPVAPPAGSPPQGWGAPPPSGPTPPAGPPQGQPMPPTGWAPQGQPPAAPPNGQSWQGGPPAAASGAPGAPPTWGQQR